jgi:histidinol dehydrogenase
MPHKLDTRRDDFEASFQAFLNLRRDAGANVDARVADILAAVAERGDGALVDYTAELDRHRISAAELRVTPERQAAALDACDGETIKALDLARERIEAFHRHQMPRNHETTDALGIRMGDRWTAVDAAGLYVPGGTAAYPSSVLMNAIPAKVAGVDRLVMTVPAPDGHLNPLALAAAQIAGVDEIYQVGGAQAIGALAYGTETIAPVDKIVGPGNAYVASAKKQVFGRVGIDSIAGPSEVLIVADRDNDPAVLAADLLAQSEHDTAAQAILVTDDDDLAAAVERAVQQHLQILPRADIAGASWRDYGAIVRVDGMGAALDIVNRVAPEHLELAVRDPDGLLDGVRHAGAIFLGNTTPEVIGDYVGGPNHVLPTDRCARFASGLSVLDFMKRSTLLQCNPEGLQAIGPAGVTLARAEGLDAHAMSLTLRLKAEGTTD